MADSYQSSSSSSSSTPTVVNTPQTDWGLQLSKLLSILAQGQYAWAMDQYNKGVAVSDAMISNFMQLSGQGAGLAKNLIQQYQDQFAPLNQQYIAQANSYNSEARQRFEMGRAESNVNQAMTAGADEAERKLQSFGINPADGRYQDLINIDRMKKAAAMAGAGTQAGLDTADRGRAMTEKAIQFGQNVPGMAVNAANSAIQATTGAQNANLGQQNAGATLSQTAAPFFNASAAANKTPPVGQTSSGGSSSNGKSSSPDRDSNNNRQPTGSSREPHSPTNPNDMGYGNGGPGAKSASSLGLPSFGGRGGTAAITDVPMGWDEYNQQNSPEAWGEYQGGIDSMLGGAAGNTDWGGAQEPSGESPNDNTFGDFDPQDTSGGYGSDPYAMPEGGDNSYGDWYSGGDMGGSSGYSGQGAVTDTSDQSNFGDTSYDSGGGYDEGFDEGGPVPRSASPSRGRQTDDISARLNAGEYVIPRDVVSQHGPDYFRNLIEKSRRSRSGMAGPPPKAKLKPALNRTPTFVSR